MKVSIEKFSNPNFLRINVDERIDSHSEEKFIKGTRIIEQTRIFYALRNIDGIENVTLRDYSIIMSKGSFFKWDIIVPLTLKAIQKSLGVDKKVELVDAASDVGSDSGIDLNS